MDIQSDILGSWEVNHQDALTTRALAVKPTFSQEFAQGYESGFSRIKAWSVFVAGQAGVGTGAYLVWLAEFASTVAFHRMQPADALVVSGEGYCMAQAGVEYVVYFPQGERSCSTFRGPAAPSRRSGSIRGPVSGRARARSAGAAPSPSSPRRETTTWRCGCGVREIPRPRP